MKKAILITVLFLLYPVLSFAQCNPCNSDKDIIIDKTDFFTNALQTDLGQKIISQLENTVGAINPNEAKNLSTPKGDLTIVPIKADESFWKALGFIRMNDGNEFIVIVDFNIEQKTASMSFASGKKYIFGYFGMKEEFNSTTMHQQFDDINNKINFIGTYGTCDVIYFLCRVCAALLPFCLLILLLPCIIYYGWCV